MARKRNARRVILADLRTVNQWMRWAVAHFDQSGKVYHAESGEPGIRPRRADEYIENQPANLRKFAAGARDLAAAMVIIAEKAEQRAAEVEAAQEAAKEAAAESCV